jgi:hypothetical protein
MPGDVGADLGRRGMADGGLVLRSMDAVDSKKSLVISTASVQLRRTYVNDLLQGARSELRCLHVATSRSGHLSNQASGGSAPRRRVAAAPPGYKAQKRSDMGWLRKLSRLIFLLRKSEFGGATLCAPRGESVGVVGLGRSANEPIACV